MRKAKILATLGPASREPAVLEALLTAGTNGVRINMSHGTQEEHAETISRARAAAERLKRPLAVLVDLSGPKIRTGVLRGGQPVMLEDGALFTITTRSVAGDAREVSTNYPTIARDVQPGARLLLDDGAGREREDGVGFERDGLAVLEHARPDLRPRQVNEHGERPAEALGGGARAPDRLGVLLLRAVRHVDAHGVRARGEERLQSCRLARRRPQRREYLGSSHSFVNRKPKSREQ